MLCQHVSHKKASLTNLKEGKKAFIITQAYKVKTHMLHTDTELEQGDRRSEEPQFGLPTVRGYDPYQTHCQSAYCVRVGAETHTYTHTSNAITYIVAMTIVGRQ